MTSPVVPGVSTAGKFVPRPKDAAALQAQTALASARIGEELLPPGVPRAALEQQSFSELKQNWRFRTDAFLAALRTGRVDGELPPAQQEQLRESLKILNNLARYLVEHNQRGDAVLREPQVKVVEDVLAALERGENRMYVKCPTGFGKTVIFSVIAAAMGAKTLVAVPKRLLVGQTSAKFEKFAPGVQVSEIYGERKDAAGDVNIMTYDYLYDQVKAGHDLSKYRLIILDEAHKVLEPQGKKLLELIPKHVKVLGFTATPEYNSDKSLDNHLGECCHRIDLPEGVRLGCLAPCAVFVAKTGINLTNVKLKENGDYDEAELSKAYALAGLNQACLQLYRRAFSGESAIGFCAGVAQAEDAAQEFSAASITAAALSGKTPKKERERILKAYESGAIKVLFSADLLIEGFDSERAAVCFNLAPTRSIVNAEQRGGRVLRLNPKDSNKLGVIIDFLAEDTRAVEPQILFSDIIGGTACPPPAEQDAAMKKRLEAVSQSLAVIKIEGLEVIVDAHKITQLSKELETAAHQRRLAAGEKAAPADWLSLDQLAKEVGRSPESVRGSIYRLGTKVRHLYGRFFAPQFGRRVDRFAPELVEMVAAERQEHLEKGGWMTLSALARKVGTTSDRLERAFPVDMVEGVDFVTTNRLASQGQRVRLFSPDLIAKLGETKTIPAGFVALNLRECTELFGAPAFVARGYIKNLQARRPDDFFVDDTLAAPKAYISRPALAELQGLAEKWLGRPRDRSTTVSDLAAHLGATPAAIIKTIERQRAATAAPSLGIGPGASAAPVPVTAETVLNLSVARQVVSALACELPPPAGWTKLPPARGHSGSVDHRLLGKLPDWWTVSFKDPALGIAVEYLHPRAQYVLAQVQTYRDQIRVQGINRFDLDELDFKPLA